MDNKKETTKIHHVHAHGTTTLEVVYTNEPEEVEKTIAMYEQWLQEEKYKFLGLDLEYKETRPLE